MARRIIIDVLLACSSPPALGYVCDHALGLGRADRAAVVLSGPGSALVAVLGPPAAALEALARGLPALTGNGGVAQTWLVRSRRWAPSSSRSCS